MVHEPGELLLTLIPGSYLQSVSGGWEVSLTLKTRLAHLFNVLDCFGSAQVTISHSPNSSICLSSVSIAPFIEALKADIVAIHCTQGGGRHKSTLYLPQDQQNVPDTDV